MRVAVVDPSLFTLPYDSMLVQGLRAAGHAPKLYGRRPRASDGDAVDAELVPSFYPLAESRMANALPGPLRLGLKGVDHLLSMARLRRILSAPEHRPDVIHFQWLPLPAADRRLLAGFRRIAPLVLTVHDTDPFNGNPASRLQRLGAEACLACFDLLIVHTTQGLWRLRAQGVPASRIALLPHGLLTPPAPAGPDPMEGALTFLCFGRMKPYKGLDVAIEAFAGLPLELRAGSRLRIVGQAQMDLAPLDAQVRRHGLGGSVAIEPRFVPDAELPGLFGPGTVALFPYREIEASGVLSLALAQGRPVIASRIGGFAEVLDDGTHGLLVPPGQAEPLANAMAQMLADRAFAARCAGAVQTLARSQPGWEEIARRTAALYAGLLPHGGRACAA